MKKTLKIVVVTVLSCVAIFAILVGTWFVKFTTQPPPFICKVEMPDSISIMDSAKIQFTITNQGQKAKEFESIDIYRSFLDNFSVIEKSENVKYARESTNFISFYVNERIESMQSKFVEILLIPKGRGAFVGDVMVMTPNNEITHSAIGLAVK